MSNECVKHGWRANAYDLSCPYCTRAELERLRAENMKHVAHSYRVLNENISLRNQIAEYEWALKYYGAFETWMPTTTESTLDGIGCEDFEVYKATGFEPRQVAGAKARTTLARWGKEK